MTGWDSRPCEPVEKYEKLNRVGEGTYGVVYRARDKKTGEIVALKRIRLRPESSRRERERRKSSDAKKQRFDEEGFPVTSLREIVLLQKLSHRNVINLREVVVKHGSKVSDERYFLVFDYCDHDIGRILDDHLYSRKERFSESEVKCIMTQILSGLQYLHSEWIVHRDLKVSNLLYNSRGEVKLADFGLARFFGSPLRPYTPRVVTLWYRAPELLLRDETVSDPRTLPGDMRKLHYSTAIDLWAAGCIFGELLLGKPLLPGKDEIDQLKRIFDLLGEPNERIWPKVERLLNKMKVSIASQPYNRLRQVFPRLGGSGLDLLDGLLAYDPQQRYSASEALNHEYFSEEPWPAKPGEMPKFQTSPEV